MFTSKIDIYTPSGTISFEEGVANCQKINVHFYFANVVYIVVYMTTGEQYHYYQVAAMLTKTPV